MSELRMALGNSAAPHEFTACDKTYKVKLVDGEMKTAYAMRCYGHAKIAVKDMRDMLDTNEYLALVRELKDAYEVGEFDFGGKRANQALKSPRGATILLSLILGVPEPEAQQAFLANPVEAAEVLEHVLRESFPHVQVTEVKKNDSELTL
jgi:hypothetical protein